MYFSRYAPLFQREDDAHGLHNSMVELYHIVRAIAASWSPQPHGASHGGSQRLHYPGPPIEASDVKEVAANFLGLHAHREKPTQE